MSILFPLTLVIHLLGFFFVKVKKKEEEKKGKREGDGERGEFIRLIGSVIQKGSNLFIFFV